MGDYEAPRTPRGVRLRFTALALVPVLVSAVCITLSWTGADRSDALGWLPVAALMTWLLWWRRSPPRHLLRGWIRCLLALALAVSLIRAMLFTDGSLWGFGLLISVAFCLAIVVVLTRNCRDHSDIPLVSTPLLLPFAEGTWLVVQGGGTKSVNHHVVVPQQRAALDLVRMRSDGTRARGVFPPEPGDYAAYGTVVVAPCDGVVLRAVDGLPDQAPLVPNPTRPPGNSVRIDTGREQVLLAHLVPGSVPVEAGQRVARGDVIGRVGNSGNTTEPHLHIHAERDGVGVRLVFDGVDEPLLRGTRMRADAR